MLRLIVVLLCLPICLAANIDDEILLKSIRRVETNDNHCKIGRKQEKTAYQFIRATWREYSKADFNKINRLEYKVEAERVARLHLAKIKWFLLKNGYSVNPKNIALIWNGGMHGFETGRIYNSTITYSYNVNYYYELYLSLNRLNKPIVIKIDAEY
jgi:hypothetical protein